MLIWVLSVKILPLKYLDLHQFSLIHFGNVRKSVKILSFFSNIAQPRKICPSKYLGCTSVETGSGHPGHPRVTFSPGHPGLTRFTIYPGLTRIESREKRNCSFDDVETYKRYREKNNKKNSLQNNKRYRVALS